MFQGMTNAPEAFLPCTAVIIVRNGISDLSSNPGQGYLHFLYTIGKGMNSSRGACGVMVIVAGYGHGDSSSNPGRD